MGLISTISGFLVFMVMLLFAVEVVFGLYSRTLVTAVAADVAQETAISAASGSFSASKVDRDIARRLGDYGDDVSTTVIIVDSNGDGEKDSVVITVTAALPSLVPANWSGPSAGSFRRTVRGPHRRHRCDMTGHSKSIRVSWLCRSDRGMAGGMEAIPFGILIFVAGALLLASTWGVVDARAAADQAAREATRYIVESAGIESDMAVVRNARVIASTAMAERGHQDHVTISIHTDSTGLSRCARITVTVSIQIESIRAPFMGQVGPRTTVKASHSQLIDPLRSGLEGQATCVG